MVPEGYQAAADTDEDNAGSFYDTVRLYRIVSESTDQDAISEEPDQPVLSYACNAADLHRAGVPVDSAVSGSAGIQVVSAVALDDGVQREYSGRGYGDRGIVRGDLRTAGDIRKGITVQERFCEYAVYHIQPRIYRGTPIVPLHEERSCDHLLPRAVSLSAR